MDNIALLNKCINSLTVEMKADRLEFTEFTFLENLLYDLNKIKTRLEIKKSNL